MRIRKTDQAALARILRKVREDAGLTQSEVASRLGVQQSFVSKYESGERRLDLLELRQVCRALNSSLATFVNQVERTLGGAE